MFTAILSRKPHSLGGILSVNKALQLINLLGRPLAEVNRLIIENRQLLKRTTSSASNQIKHEQGQIVLLDYPRMVCASEKCKNLSGSRIEQKLLILSIAIQNVI